MSNIRLWIPNTLAEGFCTFSTDGFSGLEPADKPSSNLKTEEPSEVAAFTILDPKHTNWFFNLADVKSEFAAFALGGHNLTPRSLVRFQVGKILGAGANVIYTQAPNAITSSTNITGTVTDVDEAIDSPDGNVIEPTNKLSSWSATFGWGSLSVTPKLGAHMGQVVLRLRRNFTGAGADNPLDYPKLEVTLKESGVTIRQLGTRAVTSIVAGGQIFIYTFDFSELSNPSGSNIEVQVGSTIGVSASGGQHSTLESISLYYEDENEVLDGDSLWIVVPERGNIDAPTQSIHHLVDGGTTTWEDMVVGTIRIISDQSIHDPRPMDALPVRFTIPVGMIPNEPLTYIEVGIASGSVTMAPEVGIQQEGPLVGIQTEEVAGRTIGGQSYGADSYRFRHTQDIELVVSREEKDALLDLLNWQRGLSGAFYVALEPHLTLAEQVFTSFWATLKADIGTPRQIIGSENFKLTVSFEEKL